LRLRCHTRRGTLGAFHDDDFEASEPKMTSLVPSWRRFLGAGTACAVMILTAACGPTEGRAPGAPATAPPAPGDDAPATRRAAMADPDGPNWIAGAGPYTLLVGEDGAPDNAAGRLANDGAGISVAAIGGNGWIIAGPDGTSAWLDAQGARQRGDLRELLDGLTPNFLALGAQTAQPDPVEAFLIGGGEGRVQIINNIGEPTQITRQVFTSGEATASAYDPASRRWLVGSSEGILRALTIELNDSATASNWTTEPITAIVANPDTLATSRWLTFAGGSCSLHQSGAVTTLVPDATITTATRTADDDVLVGTDDGRVARVPFTDLDAEITTWTDALGGAAVRGFAFDGTRWVAYGDGGAARVLDDQGAPAGELATLGDGSALRAAYASADAIVFGTETSFLVTTDSDLSPVAQGDQPLGDTEIWDVAAGAGHALVVGGDQARLLDDRGAPLAAAITVAGADLRAAEWSGEAYLVAGDGGVAQVVDAQGAAQGAALSLLGGADVRDVAWNGIFWLAVGADGQAERVREDGSSAGTLQTDLDQAWAARWSGFEWLVVGEKDGTAAVQLVDREGATASTLATIPGMTGPLRALDWNGREFLVGGDAGLVHIVSSSGTPRPEPRPQPRDVLAGQAIHAIDYHDNAFLVGGEGGLVRRVLTDLSTDGSPVAIGGFETVRALRWSLARGFGGGECLTGTSCYEGPCVGSGSDAFCCDAACDRACESCLEQFTGQPDGTCAPVTSGQAPPSGGCVQEAEATCGLTGLCDGAGECANYGAETTCSAPSCSEGIVTPAGTCNGSGSCTTGEDLTCDPYLTCDADACATACVSTNDCVDGFVCNGGACVEPVEGTDGDADEGCCASAPAHSPATPWLGALALLALVGLRTRRDRA
jgi:MYXO-CTERM domain-containing protein